MKWIDIPPVWLLLAIIIAVLIAGVLPWPGSGPWLRLAGTVLIALGLTLVAMSALEFRRHRTSVIPHRMPTALVTEGIYGLSRNPIYLGDALVLAGVCLLLGSLAALVTVPAFMTLIARRFIGPEEARLAAAFGPDFSAWAARTRRWL